jgi:hypothetical protein
VASASYTVVVTGMTAGGAPDRDDAAGVKRGDVGVSELFAQPATIRATKMRVGRVNGRMGRFRWREDENAGVRRIVDRN